MLQVHELEAGREDLLGRLWREEKARDSAGEDQRMLMEQVQILECSIASLQEEMLRSRDRSLRSAQSAVMRVHASATARVAEVSAELDAVHLKLEEAEMRGNKEESRRARNEQLVVTLRNDVVVSIQQANELASLSKQAEDAAGLVETRLQISEAMQADQSRQMEELTSCVANIESHFQHVLQCEKEGYEKGERAREGKKGRRLVAGRRFTERIAEFECIYSCLVGF